MAKLEDNSLHLSAIVLIPIASSIYPYIGAAFICHRPHPIASSVYSYIGAAMIFSQLMWFSSVRGNSDDGE